MNLSPTRSGALLSRLLVFSVLIAGVRLPVSGQIETGHSAGHISNDPVSLSVERLAITNGAELLTIFGKLTDPAGNNKEAKIPLVSVLRDTLGDDRKENDRLRYVWVFPYTNPTLRQRAFAAVPFFYNRAGNKTVAKAELPSEILDLTASSHSVWRRIFWDEVQRILFDSQGFVVKASTQTYRRNLQDYQTGHTIRALAILSLLESEDSAKSVFSNVELQEIQARLMLTEKELGGLVDDQYLRRVYEKESRQSLDVRGQNWELLRQRSEAEGLYFEPLTLSDGSATHAIIWVARKDLERNEGSRFNSRFLNIGSPWSDDHLRNWRGYTEMRYFDSQGRRVEQSDPDSHCVELIPLALYGLDHPRIPILLVDFRNSSNAKRREVSRRMLQDVARNVLSLSRFNNPYYFLAMGIFDLTIYQRGMDINQMSRVQAYSQLKLLLSLDQSLSGELRTQISRDIERTSANPLENDIDAEIKLANQQYEALIKYSQRPDGLAARISRDRADEARSYVHGRAARGFLQVARTLSLGLYAHRERSTPELMGTIDSERTLDYHERFLRQAASSSPQIEITYNIDDVKRSLNFIKDSAAESDSGTARVVALVFGHTANDEIRGLSLSCLYQINDRLAKNELLRIYQDQSVDSQWRKMSAEYLRLAMREQQRIAPSDAKVIVRIDEQ